MIPAGEFTPEHFNELWASTLEVRSGSIPYAPLLERSRERTSRSHEL
jgi:hypothetical protein